MKIPLLPSVLCLLLLSCQKNSTDFSAPAEPVTSTRLTDSDTSFASCKGLRMPPLQINYYPDPSFANFINWVVRFDPPHYSQDFVVGNQSIVIFRSPNFVYNLTFQTDGNLVLYKNNSQALWSSGTNGLPCKILSFQWDGNIVLYNSDKSYAYWATGTNYYFQQVSSDQASFAIQNDGNLVNYRIEQPLVGNTKYYVIWASDTQNGTVSCHH